MGTVCRDRLLGRNVIGLARAIIRVLSSQEVCCSSGTEITLNVCKYSPAVTDEHQIFQSHLFALHVIPATSATVVPATSTSSLLADLNEEIPQAREACKGQNIGHFC